MSEKANYCVMGICMLTVILWLLFQIYRGHEYRSLEGGGNRSLAAITAFEDYYFDEPKEIESVGAEEYLKKMCGLASIESAFDEDFRFYKKCCCFSENLEDVLKLLSAKKKMELCEGLEASTVETTCCKKTYEIFSVNIEKHGSLDIIRREMFFSCSLMVDPIPHSTGADAVYLENGTIYFFYEKLQSLAGFQVFENGVLDEKKFHKYAWSLYTAIHNIHRKKLVHGNLSLDSIGINSKNVLKIEGFYRSKYLHSTVEYKGIQNNTFLPPEVQEDYSLASFSTDWYSYGAILYNLIKNRAPYSNSPNNTILHAIASSLSLLSQKKRNAQILNVNIPKDLKDLIESLIKLSPEERLGTGVDPDNEVYSHEYFQKRRGTVRVKSN